MESFDIITLGAGMVGASIAGEFRGRARALLLGREERPGYDSTDRSATAFIPFYGHDKPSFCSLTECSCDSLPDPSEIFRTKAPLHRGGLAVLCAPGEEAGFDPAWISPRRREANVALHKAGQVA